ncbi:MAG TPA: undecaprenyl-diphosphate phosphatase, partial [bacterium]|nr:undecaprenyl-diphosphate phosphatase [bacterium]
SRSGMTIFGGLSSGLEPEEAARFSFALSIPAILGGNLIQLIKNPDFSHWVPWLPGFFISVISGIFALFLLIRLVSKRKLFFFSFYSLLLAVSLFAIILFR